jgi:hypothetical protein
MWALRWSVMRGTAIGSMIGMIPGAGATVGAVIAYGVEKQASPRGAEFGTGVPDGLTAPEAAKNATTGAAMIPLLTLGIPGSAATAIMLAALVLKGVTPGPMLFSTQTDLVYAIFASMLLANLFMIVAGVVIARGFSHFMKVPPAILSGFIVVLSVLGAYGVRNNIFDVYVCMVFGVIGYLMKRYNFPPAPLVLGVILGPLAERYFLTSLARTTTTRPLDLRHAPDQRQHPRLWIRASPIASSNGRAARCWAVPVRSTVCCTSAASGPTTITGRIWATQAGVTTMCCPISASRKTSSAGPTRITAWAGRRRFQTCV